MKSKLVADSVTQSVTQEVLCQWLQVVTDLSFCNVLTESTPKPCGPAAHSSNWVPWGRMGPPPNRPFLWEIDRMAQQLLNGEPHMVWSHSSGFKKYFFNFWSQIPLFGGGLPPFWKTRSTFLKVLYRIWSLGLVLKAKKKSTYFGHKWLVTTSMVTKHILLHI